MGRTFALLLDAPTTPASRMPLARLGEFNDPKRYGEFKITANDVKSWQSNLKHLPGERALIDFDHRADKPSPHRDTKAAGWITGIEQDGDMAYASVEWTPQGEEAVRNKTYLFTSPVFGPWADETGTTYDNVLAGAALTNKPFLGSMPMVTLASEASIHQALEQDPAAALFQRALDGDLGEDARRLALGEDTPDEPAANDDRDRTILDLQIDGRTLELDVAGEIVALDTLSTEARNNLNDSDFALPGRRYPIHDVSHARNALARVAANGNSDEQAKVRAAVYRKYPALRPGKQMDASDSRGQMLTKDDIQRLAGLAGITDEGEITKLVDLGTGDNAAEPAKVLEAIEAAKPEVKTLEEQAEEKGLKILDSDEHERLTREAEEGAEAKRQLDEANGGEPTKTLEQRAEEAGLKVIDPDKLTTLEQAATKVVVLENQVGELRENAETARRELENQRFEQAYDKAEAEGRAAPAEKERYQKWYALDADTAIEQLENAAPAFSTRPRGRNASAGDDGVPDGVKADEYQLEQRVRAYMGEHAGMDYLTALEQVAQFEMPERSV